MPFSTIVLQMICIALILITKFKADIEMFLGDNGIDAEIIGVKLIGSRIAGSPRTDSDLTQNEEVIYTSEGITPAQQSLLKRPNSSQYTADQELSESKGSENSEATKEIDSKPAFPTHSIAEGHW